MEGSWPLGFGLLDIGIPIIGIILVVGLVVGVILLLISMKEKNDETDLSTTEEKSNF
jgi:hypothetical protein